MGKNVMTEKEFQKHMKQRSVRLSFTVLLFLFALSAHSTDMEEKMKITVGNATFTATLEDNATTNGDSRRYSLGGTRVTESHKGIYIKNGKKYR